MIDVGFGRLTLAPLMDMLAGSEIQRPRQLEHRVAQFKVPLV